MHRSCNNTVRVLVGAAVTLGVLVVQLGMFQSSSYAQGAPIHVGDATPTPTPTLMRDSGVGRAGATPTAVVPPGVPTPALPTLQPLQPFSSAPGGTNSASTSVLQQTSDQIASVSQQVTQAVQDPSLTVEAKVQQINGLAAQFNQLVGQWQQQLAQNQGFAGGASAPQTAGLATPTPVGGVITGVGATPTASVNRLSPAGGQTADQLRAQIASLSQQMAQVSADTSLSADARNAQLSALGVQFNQLMLQLQQLGG